MLSIFIEQIINHILATDSDIDTSLLDKKVVLMSITDTSINWVIVFNGRRISILSKQESPAAYDLDMVLSQQAVVQLTQGDVAKDLLKSDEIKVVGDAKIAQAVLDLATSLEPNYEEILSLYTGEWAAQSIGVGVKFLKENPPPQAALDFGKKVVQKIGQTIVSW